MYVIASDATALKIIAFNSKSAVKSEAIRSPDIIASLSWLSADRDQVQTNRKIPMTNSWPEQSKAL